MFDKAHGSPFSAIPAEPEKVNHTSWNSSTDNASVVDDSMFDRSGKRTSVSSESVVPHDLNVPSLTNFVSLPTYA